MNSTFYKRASSFGTFLLVATVVLFKNEIRAMTLLPDAVASASAQARVSGMAEKDPRSRLVP